MRFDRSTSLLCELSDHLADLVATALPAVVTLRGVTTAMEEWSGSGFLLDSLGHVVTNHHVIDGLGARIFATMHGGDEAMVEIVGADPITDLAILRLTGGAEACLPVRADRPRVGELCLAIGSPFGEYAESVSLGVVSGLDRSFPRLDGEWTMEHMIQTDAAINPGNSGGPLVDMAGEVIGVNECRETDGQNIGFAVPAETVSFVAAELIAHGSIARAALGIVVATRSVTNGGGRSLRRLVVTEVKTPGPFRVGDALVSVAGSIVRDRGELFRSLTRELIEKPTAVEIVRDGTRTTIEVVPNHAKHAEV